MKTFKHENPEQIVKIGPVIDPVEEYLYHSCQSFSSYSTNNIWLEDDLVPATITIGGQIFDIIGQINDTHYIVRNQSGDRIGTISI